MYRKLLIIFLICLSILISGCSKTGAVIDEDSDDVIIFQNTAAQAATGAAGVTAESEYKLQNDNAAVTYAAAYGFTEDLNYDVKAFIRQYYDYLAAGEYDLAAYMTNDSSRLDRDVFMQRSEYIESVKSLTCYMMEGMTDGTYIVVARCGVQTSLGTQVVFFMEAFYVCTNESGTFYICGNGAGDEVMSYNSIMLSDQRILDVITEVAEDNSEAVDQQENLTEVKGIVYSDEIFRYLYEQPAAPQ